MEDQVQDKEKLLDELLEFMTLIKFYFKATEPNYKNYLLSRIKTELQSDSPYTAFKTRYVRDKYMAEFGHLIP